MLCPPSTMAATTGRRPPRTHARQPMTPQSHPPSQERAPGPAADLDGPDLEAGDLTDAVDAPGRRWLPYAVAGAAYLVLSSILWWHVMPHPRTVTTCGCGDAALTIWVIKWPAYALSHGLNPFYSSKLLVPRGINMAPNSLVLGVVFAPVTWLFGPVASLNLIDVASPPLSALAMFWLLRRWVAWDPAAFVGGLFFGFSPFVVVSLALAHPNFGLLAPVPLIIGCIDDLFVRHRHRVLVVGAALGALVTVEFFISVEVLLLVALFASMTALVVGSRALAHRPSATSTTVRRALPGLCVAGGLAAVLLAYPLWFFFAGPAHLVGRAWPDEPPGAVANTPAQFVDGFFGAPLTGIMHLFGGYQGPTLPLLSYLGIGVLVVVVGGVAVWRHDRLLWCFGLIGLLAAVLSLGVGDGYWAPWRLFTHLPLLDNVVPVNLTVIIDTCVAVLLAVVVGHVRAAAVPRVGPRGAALAGVATAGLALVPVAGALWPNIPMTVRTVVVPRWFTSVAPRLGNGQVVLPYPTALGGIQSSMAWQAVAGMTFSMVGGGGPGITRSRAGPEAPGFAVLARATLHLGPPPQPGTAELHAVRQALAGWGVTTVVVPDQPGLPTYDRGRGVPYAVGLFTTALGRAPVHQASAWVWDHVGSAGPSITISPSAFVACTGVDSNAGSGAVVAACVLHQA